MHLALILLVAVKLIAANDPPLPWWAIIKQNSRVDADGQPLWEGDIIMHRPVNAVNERTARKDLKSRWPQGRIPYKIDNSLNIPAAKTSISQAMKLWMGNTCVSFVNSPSTTGVPHLVLKHTGTGCNSWVGIFNQFTTDQTVSLDYPGCATSVPTIAHELGHAIGLWHEQDRLDRDQYLKIYKSNMGNNSIYFETSGKDVMHYDVPYEYASIMQYTPDAFTTNRRLTLVPKDPMAFPFMGNAEKVTHLDFKIVNRMYNCSEYCQHPLNCLNGGYYTWNHAKGCRCECPPGFSGTNCQTKVHVEPPCGGRILSKTRLQSPNYPNDHPAGLRCSWLIKAPTGKSVELTFHDFQLMDRAGNDNLCYWSAMRIRKGDLLSDDPGQIYCKSELKGTHKLPGPQVLLIFTTSYNLARGFDLTIDFV